MCWCQSVRINCRHWPKEQMTEAIFKPEFSLLEILPAHVLYLQQWMLITRMSQTHLFVFLIDCHWNSIPVLCYFNVLSPFGTHQFPDRAEFPPGSLNTRAPGRDGVVVYHEMRWARLAPPGGSWHSLSLTLGMLAVSCTANWDLPGGKI